MKRVLIVTKAAKSDANLRVTKGFAASLSQKASGVAFAGCAVQDLLFSVRNGTMSITLRGKELRTLCNVIHLRNTNLFSDYANALRVYADQFGIELVNRADATLPYYGKVSQGFLLASHGISTPSFLSSFSNDTLLEALPSAEFGFPMVIKHGNGTRGLDNYLVDDLAEAASVLKEDKPGFMAQQFIANDGELRILRFGSYVDPLIFKKQAPAGGYLNNTSQGGSGTLMSLADVNPDLLHQATEAARLMGRDVAGVDVLLSKDGKFYVLEVNLTPSLASGVLLEEKMKLYSTFFSHTAEEDSQ